MNRYWIILMAVVVAALTVFFIAASNVTPRTFEARILAIEPRTAREYDCERPGDFYSDLAYLELKLDRSVDIQVNDSNETIQTDELIVTLPPRYSGDERVNFAELIRKQADSHVLWEYQVYMTPRCVDTGDGNPARLSQLFKLVPR
ncbi:MAG: hypothetical protein A3K06_03410 [Candidatus Doudnabacteria bacterium RIFCSPHIGHO2_01_52_17]|uniref:Uncharacterized protein n=1 Tax=Candidatus Doudnabacteria bacterium RIFCSPHIGHO2_01_52_17 TaxID=1817820 RepID=A0A1F5NDT8_9BACT|nr:MAG: hypothetical protein UY73_C0003G0011 [Parcubacteria group bacterium GW2011_GWA2_52_8]OGE75816.1 MAG: hypothetical protein A3K06_03410 [Candidatus Doudnabacteria bacterium RIFCSPHIGHO2_01_52_17]